MSDFDDLRDDAGPAAANPGEADAAVSVAGDSTAAAPVNPRKRKKSSRALVLMLPLPASHSIQTPKIITLPCVWPRSCLAPPSYSPTIPAPHMAPLPSTTRFPHDDHDWP